MLRSPFIHTFMRLRQIGILVSLLIVISFIAYRLELSLPGTAPDIHNTFTLSTKPPLSQVGSFDVLGKVVEKEEAAQLLQTAEGRQALSREQGAIAITPELIELGRKAFYTETFGNEYFFTDVMGIIDGALNLGNISRAIVALGGKPTTNLQVKLDQAVTVGGKTFPSGTLLNTGLDVPAGSLFPLGMQVHKSGAAIRVGITCAACHAAVDPQSGRILEGAPNNDLDSGLLQAFATNSAAMFRQTGVNPIKIAKGDRTYINSEGQAEKLPDPKALETAVDADFLAWSPGNFDSTLDNVNNPSQNPSSYTFDAYPYGWNGFASIGWFHGLTTLNNNVHATNSDPTTGADASKPLLGIDKDNYLGVILQSAANPKFRLPVGAKPSDFFNTIDPTPGVAGLNEVIPLPTFPKGSPFSPDGLLASSAGYPVGEQLNAMSAYQNTLAPPPNGSSAVQNIESLQRGAKVFDKAGCVQCHSGRTFTNHQVIAETRIQGQPSRARALSKLPKIFAPPQTYPPSVKVPLPPDPPVLDVPTDITPERDRLLAFAVNNPAGGYKVQSLIGLYVTAPYLHDGGVAATQSALTRDAKGRYKVADPDQMGLAGTLMQNRLPDPEASLRVLVDRKLRRVAVAQNHKNSDLKAIHSDGSGHNYWVDSTAGFTPEQQTDLIRFLLSIDDDPALLPDAIASKE